MKKKYFILALTFLFLLMGQSSFGQFVSGDQDFAENFDIADDQLAKLIADMDVQLDEIIITKYKTGLESESGSDNYPEIYIFGSNGGNTQGDPNSGDDCWFCSSDNSNDLSYLDSYFENYFKGPNSGEYGYQGDDTVQHFIPFADGTNDIVTGINNGWDPGLISAGVFWIALDALSLGGDRVIFGFIRTGEEIAVPVIKSADEVAVLAPKTIGWLDDIFVVQKNIISEWKNTIANATNIQKGNFGEIASDIFLSEKGFEPLHIRLESIDAATRQGLDGVFKKAGEYFIVESKYSGTATLSTLADGTKQMSDDWIKGGNRLINAVGGNQAIYDDILNSGYRRILAETAPDGSVIYKELDEFANVIGTFIP